MFEPPIEPERSMTSMMSAPVIVVVPGQSAARVKVTDAEGEILFTGFLLEGETQDYVTEVPLELWVGNAGEVAVAVDGEDLGPSGGVGEVKEFTVGAEGIGD